MATLTIADEVRDIRFTATDLDLAEREIVKRGGRAITDVLGNHGGLFTKFELEWLLWGAWRHKLSTAKLQTLLTEFYTSGGTIYDLQMAVGEAVIDSGLYGRRRPLDDDGAGAADPPATGTSG